jgi:B12-binding domain/radical SAM domain protein
MKRLVLYYSRENRCSMNALAGALEAAGPRGLQLSFPGTAAELKAAARAAGPGSAALISFFTSQKAQAGKLAGELRAAAPGLALVAGGPHPSAAPQESLAAGFDCAVTGEGEYAVLDLAAKLAAGEPLPRGVVKGRPLADLGEFPPFPAKAGLFGPIEITRGCPFACTYCQTSYLFGGRPRHRPAADILRHMGAMLTRGLPDIRFVTPDAFAYGSPDGRRLNLPALRDLLSRAHALASGKGGRIFFGSFPSEVRPEHVTPETLELVKKYASNRRLIIGAQSGSPRVLKNVRRGHGPEEILRAARLCREFHISPYLDFIFGLPGETREDEDATMALVEELSALGAMIHTHAFMPLPGTPLAGEPGARISRRVKTFLERMESRGKAFGKWRAQSAGRVD